MNKKLIKLLKKNIIIGFNILNNPKVNKEKVINSKTYFEGLEKDKKLKIEGANEVLNSKYNYSKKYKERSKEILKIFKLAEEEKLDIVDLYILWAKISKERSDSKELYKSKPTPESRDNKGVHVGSGYPQGNTVRYPSKKRSRKTWANFYKLFPKLAILDNWDGKTSDKMK